MARLNRALWSRWTEDGSSTLGTVRAKGAQPRKDLHRGRLRPPRGITVTAFITNETLSCVQHFPEISGFIFLLSDSFTVRVF